MDAERSQKTPGKQLLFLECGREFLPGVSLAEVAPHDLIELGSVYVDDDRCLNPVRVLKQGECIRIHTNPRRYRCPVDFAQRILSENQETLLFEKPAGLPCEPQVDNFKENILGFLAEVRGQRFFLTHRLVTETEGLMLIAKSSETAARVQAAFAGGKIKRVYAAFVGSRIAQPTLVQGDDSSEGNAEIKVLSCAEWRGDTHLICEGRASWRVDGPALSSVYRVELEFSGLRPKAVREILASSGAAVLGDRSFGSVVALVDEVTGKPAMAFWPLALGLPS